MKSDNDKQPNRARRRFLVRASGGGALAGGLALAGRATATTARLGENLFRAADRDVVDVAIIGAGLAGLTSARDLQRAGCESFVVLEARDRVGGRTYNHELGDGVVSEAGGQWIGPGQTAIADLARQLEVDTFDQYYQGKTVYLAGDARYAEASSTGGASVSHHIAIKLNDMARSVPGDAPWTAQNAAELDSMSVGEWLQQQGVSMPVIWSYDNSPPDGSVGVINAFIKPGQLTHDAKQAESVLTDIYARALGEEARHPTQFHDHDWGKVDSWSLTCIHPIPPGFWTRWGKFLRLPIGRLIWSGTETADIWPGAMDGAVRSGHRAAFQALHALTQVGRNT